MEQFVRGGMYSVIGCRISPDQYDKKTRFCVMINPRFGGGEVLIIPTSSSYKSGVPIFTPQKKLFNTVQIDLIQQVRIMQIGKMVGMCSQEEMEKIDKCLSWATGLSDVSSPPDFYVNSCEVELGRQSQIYEFIPNYPKEISKGTFGYHIMEQLHHILPGEAIPIQMYHDIRNIFISIQKIKNQSYKDKEDLKNAISLIKAPDPSISIEGSTSEETAVEEDSDKFDSEKHSPLENSSDSEIIQDKYNAISEDITVTENIPDTAKFTFNADRVSTKEERRFLFSGSDQEVCSIFGISSPEELVHVRSNIKSNCAKTNGDSIRAFVHLSNVKHYGSTKSLNEYQDKEVMWIRQLICMVRIGAGKHYGIKACGMPIQEFCSFFIPQFPEYYKNHK